MDVTFDARLRIDVSPRDETDFETQYLTHYDGVYRLLYRIVGSREEAEDLAQETFLRLHDRRFSTGEARDVRAWLWRVASNLAYNHVRDRARRGRRDGVSAERGLAVADPPRDPDAAAVQASEVEVVRCALAMLPRRQSELLVLRYAGLSYREVAAALGVAPASVGTLLARAETAFETAYQSLALELEGSGRDGL